MKNERIAIETDPNDPEDGAVTVEALEQALAEREERRRARGRPVGSFTSEKERVTLRLDTAALDHFRAGGPGWQTRVNDTLRKAAGLQDRPAPMNRMGQMLDDARQMVGLKPRR